MANYCFNCGSEIEAQWNVCPNCGVNLKEEQAHNVIQQPASYQPQPYSSQQYPAQPQYYASPSASNNNGIIALIMGIFGICCGLILGPIAIIYGIKGRTQDAEPTLGTIGLILGICDIIYGAIVMVMVLTGMLYYY